MSLRSNQTRGFTLIELMVVAAIVAILGAIAFPSYVDYVRKARMVDAQMVLLEAAQWMEKVYSVGLAQGGTTLQANQYPSAAEFASHSGLTQSPKGSGTAYYLINKSAGSGQAYTLTATPQGAQDWRSCGALTINHLGVKGVGAGGTVATCWP